MWKGGRRREEGTSPHAPHSLLSSVEAEWPAQGHTGDQAGWGQRERGAVAGLKQQSPFLIRWLPTFPSGQPGRCKSEFTPYKNESGPFPLEKTPETWAALLAFPLDQCDQGRS